MFNSRYNRKIVLLVFTISNISLIYLIWGEITHTKQVLYDEDDVQEHPGFTTNTSAFTTTTSMMVEPDITKNNFTMPPIYHIGTTDPTSHRKIVAEIFNPAAYYNVDLTYLESLISKAFREIQIECEKMTSAKSRELSEKSGLPLCSCAPETLGGRIKLDLAPPNLKQLEDEMSSLGVEAGHWSPTDCIARQRLALIVPYKDRATHLHVFLNHYHRMLQRQKIEYKIFLSEQAHPEVFNKGSIMNAGFHIAKAEYDFDCVIFHDIDLLAEDDRHLYLCSSQPRHITARNDRNNYTKPYGDLVGGAVAMTKDTFIQINGYTNEFYGWGGEDDNLALRYRQMKENARKVKTEGLNSIKYILHELQNKTLFTWLLAELKNDVSEFRDRSGWCDGGHYRYGRRATIQKCAERCKTESQCILFSYVFSKVPTCYLFDKKCDVKEHKDFVAYTFVKKSTLVTNSTFIT